MQDDMKILNSICDQMRGLSDAGLYFLEVSVLPSERHRRSANNTVEEIVGTEIPRHLSGRAAPAREREPHALDRLAGGR